MKNKLEDMVGLDFYLSNLSEKEYKKIENRISTLNSSMMPLLSWDFFMDNYHKKIIESRKNKELLHFQSLAKKYNWKNNLKQEFSVNDYEALVITDAQQKIIWVNEGFSTMTGYSKKFAINKTPKFLQGEKTSTETKNRIKENLTNNKPFKEVIINYRKDKTSYNCEVKIIPLYNKEVTHFIAFEKEVI
ncbi:PAS domain S-box-containing protein [Mesonia phycicola]|uniref:PAS domain S-box-containing protein n=1 Tax=Mesonia phycicola TaxID=579105 RepID=A0A1M6A3U5_9FLAO|nr:PAS domain-containing protein [Mesonia phycicola]SHI31095.1 PAS domain S-box-containing protein [Mesonia phycicola]